MLLFNIKTFSLISIFILSINVTNASVIIDFDLSANGFTQDTPVAENYFSSQDLLLGSGVVTACGGACISTPAATYSGVLTGNFINNTYSYLLFDAVLNNTIISLYDNVNSLVATLSSANGYFYWGSIGIASFSADLNYDGLYSLTLDQSNSAIPEPSIIALMVLGIFSLNLFRRKKK